MQISLVNIFAIMTDIKSVLRELEPGTLPGAIFYALIFGVLAWLVGRAVNLGFQRLLEKPKHRPVDRTAIKFIGQLARLVIYLFAFLTYAHLVPELNSLGHAWLASVGVVSVVFGLAAQNTLGNLVAGISLLLYRPFNLGDRLQVTAPSGLETGIVESLNLGYTILRTNDNRRVVIPNSSIASQTNINLSLSEIRALCVVPIRISQDADLDKARNVLIELARQNPKMLEYINCPVTALGPSTVTLNLRMWCANADAATDLKNDLLEAARKKFDVEGIQLFWRKNAERTDAEKSARNPLK